VTAAAGAFIWERADNPIIEQSLNALLLLKRAKQSAVRLRRRAMDISILVCPGCAARIRPVQPVAPGGLVRCPKCSLIFAAEAPTPAAVSLPAGAPTAPAPPAPPAPAVPKLELEELEPLDDQTPDDEPVLLRRADADEAPDAQPADEPKPPPRVPKGRRIDDDDRPARRGRRRDAADDPPRRPRPKRQGGVPVWVWLAVGGGGLLLLGLCVVGGVAVWLAGGGPNPLGGNTVTLANYYKIQRGMTEAEVKGVLGPPADTSVAPAFAGGKRDLTWRSGDGSSIIITFDNGGKVVDGACTITEPNGGATHISSFDNRGSGPRKW
jgi:hypothetical protein